MTARLLLVPFLAAVLVVGCDDDDGLRPGQFTGPGLRIIPVDAVVDVGETVDFDVVVDGIANREVTWSLAGESPAGSIDGDGVYAAPDTLPVPATVAVRARSLTVPSEDAFAEVTIVPPAGPGPQP